MANSKIEVVGPQEYALIASLYNDVFKPSRTEEFFRRRFRGRYNPLTLIAHVDDRPVGFFMGFELKPSVFFSWLYGVHQDYRRAGIASQLMDAAHAWGKEHGYQSMRLECQNQHRPMLHLAITKKYDIVGIRWDPDRSENLVLFERSLID